MTVSGDEIAALREHFAAGPDGPAGTGRCSAGPLPLVVTLHTLQLELPVTSDIPMIATDGSAPEVLAPGTVPICGCAAVAADGRMLIGWYDPVDAITRRTQHAEWQAARLGLRLAARYTDGVTMITDCREVASELRRVVTGKRPDLGAVGGPDRDAAGEIRSLAAGGRIAVAWRWVSGDESPGRTAGTALGRAAHAGAWLARRLVGDGLDPREHAEWITGVMALAPGNRESLRQRYLRHFQPAEVSRLNRDSRRPNPRDRGQGQHSSS